MLAKDRESGLVPGFVVTRDELAVLARHYSECLHEIEFGSLAFGQAAGGLEYRTTMRLRAIGELVGEPALISALAGVRTKWESIFADLKELYQTRGVDSLYEVELTDPDVRSLLERTGLIVVPQSELIPFAPKQSDSDRDGPGDGNRGVTSS
jgi:hypothetical protein